MQAAAPSEIAPQISRGSRLGALTICLLCFATWALVHGYQGIFHDAVLYTLQALARLDPGSLSQDVFLRFGSQDRFTIFSPLYAGTIHLVGAERAAAALTLAFQLALFAGALALARSVMPRALALLGVLVLIAVPGYYGPDRVFSCVEAFMTPRMAAEALVLGGIAGALCERRLLAALLIGAAALLHPIMAAAGIAALLAMYVALPYPRRALVLAIAIAAALAAAAYTMRAGSALGRFDEAWWTLIRDRSPYLFLSHWTLDDWARVAITLATLWIGGIILPDAKARVLCRAAALTTVGGLALTGIACDLLQFVLLTQLQPWRWQWLGTAAAALTLPAIVRAGWQSAALGRTTTLLLLAAWIFASNSYALASAAAAVASLAFLRRCTAREARLLFFGACGMLALAVAWRVASNLEFTDAHYLDSNIPLRVRQAMSFARDGSAPAAIMALAWWLAREAHGRAASMTLMLLAAAAAFGCLWLAPQAWASWTARDYPPPRFAEFAPLRDLIPRGAQVFWAESPLGTWLMLDRPSYLSVAQTSGMVFSRPAALEMRRRAVALSSAFSPEAFLGFAAGGGMNVSPRQLEQACGTGEFPYLVTGAVLDAAPIAAVPAEFGPAAKSIKLYRCPAGGDPPRGN
jgi:hypothetical protein